MLDNKTNSKHQKHKLLYFDCNFGITPAAINAALLALYADEDLPSLALSKFGISCIMAKLDIVYIEAGKSYKVSFLSHNGHIIDQQNISSLLAELTNKTALDNIILQWWQRGEVSLEELTKALFLGQIDSTSTAILSKIVKYINDSIAALSKLIAKEIILSPYYATLLLANIAVFLQVIKSIDPTGIYASKIAFFQNHFNDKKLSKSLDICSWSMEMVKGLPVNHRDQAVGYNDPFAIAMIRSITAYYRGVGSSLLLDSGFGYDNSLQGQAPSLVKAYEFEPNYPSTMVAEGKNHDLQQPEAILLSANISNQIDISDIVRRLTVIGAYDISTSQILTDGVKPSLLLTANIAEIYKDEAIEALLTTAEAKNVNIQHIQHQSLRQRLVTVPVGRGQKSTSCRMIEYLYGGKIIRVQPYSEDINLLVKQTGYAQEVVRSDVLSSWRRWRKDQA